MRRLFALLLLFSCSFFAYSAEENDLEKLRREYTILQKELMARRIEAIRKDPALQKYHQELLEKHREFARMLDSRKEIRELNDKLILMGRRLEYLERKQGRKAK